MKEGFVGRCEKNAETSKEKLDFTVTIIREKERKRERGGGEKEKKRSYARLNLCFVGESHKFWDLWYPTWL